MAEWLPTLAPPLGSNGFAMPYGARTKVTLEVAPSDTLQDVRRRAVHQLNPAVTGPDGISLDPLEAVHWCWFYEDRDQHGIESIGRYQHAEDLVLVDVDGRAHWHKPAPEIAYGDLVRAAECGLNRGDPLRPYIVFLYPQGDDALKTVWETFLLALEAFGQLLTAREVFRLGRHGIERLRHRMEGTEILVEHHESWSERDGGPSDIAGIAHAAPWALDDLRMLLGLGTTEGAARLLELFGLSPRPDGRYELDSREEAILLRLIAEDVIAHSTLGADPLSVDEWQSRFARILERGELPPRE